MRETGIVQKVYDGYALIQTVRKTACGENCASCSGACKLTRTQINAINEIGAKEGDVVEFEASTNQVLKSAFLVYILPLIVFFITYFIMAAVLKSNFAAYIISFAMFGLVFVILHYLDKNNHFGINSRIIDVLRSN